MTFILHVKPLPARGSLWSQIKCLFGKHRSVTQLRDDFTVAYDFCPNCGEVWL